MPILARLKEFYFYVHGDAHVLFHSMMQYALPNKQLKRIGFNMRWMDQSIMEQDVENFSHHSERFVALNNVHLWNLKQGENKLLFYAPLSLLTISFFHNIAEQDEKFVSTFNQLTMVRLTITDHSTYFNLSQLTKTLAHLSKLVYLYLGLWFDLFAHTILPGNSAAELVPLPSVLVFTLEVDTNGDSHTELTKCHFDRIFPSVQIMHLHSCSYSCRHCQIGNAITKPWARVEACVSAMLQPLADTMPNLRKIYFSYDEALPEFDEKHLFLINKCQPQIKIRTETVTEIFSSLKERVKMEIALLHNENEGSDLEKSLSDLIEASAKRLIENGQHLLLYKGNPNIES